MQTIPTETARKLIMTLGNSAVQMKVNGKSVPVGPGAPVGYAADAGEDDGAAGRPASHLRMSSVVLVASRRSGRAS